MISSYVFYRKLIIYKMLAQKVAVNVILVLILSSTGESYWQLKATGKYVQSKQKVVDSLCYQISLAHIRIL